MSKSKPRLGEKILLERHYQHSGKGTIPPSPNLIVEKPSLENREELMKRWVARRDTWRDQFLEMMIEASAAVSGIEVANELAQDHINKGISVDLNEFGNHMLSVIRACTMQKLMDNFGLDQMQKTKVTEMLMGKNHSLGSEIPSWLAKVIGDSKHGPAQNPFGNVNPNKNIRSVSRAETKPK